MLKYDLGERAIQQCPTGSTHALQGWFADPEFNAQPTTDLFCYNQNSRMGAFFTTGKTVLGNNGPNQVGKNHTFVRRWTHIVFIPILSIAVPSPHMDNLLLFYDAAAGVAEVYETDGNGNLKLKMQHSGLRTHWTQIVGGQFGKANLLFYDAANRVGAFCALSKSGDIHFIEGWS